MDSARVAAQSIAGDLGVSAPGAALPANVCYPMVAPDRALHIETHWALEQDATGAVHVRVSGHLDTVVVCALTTRLHLCWRSRIQCACAGRSRKGRPSASATR